MTGRRAAFLALLVLAAALVAVVAVTTPWSPLRAPRTAADPARDFTPAQVAREDAFHRAARPPAYLSMAAALAVATLLGLTPAGGRLVAAVARPAGGGWLAQVLLGSVALAAAGGLATLPLAAWSETVLRGYGLSTRDWTGWAVDMAKSFALGTGLTAVALAAAYAVIRAAPRTWWAWTAAGGAALAVALSFAFPVLVEPVFNRFQPMPDGPLRTSLLRLAAEDGVAVRDVLVADASRRTSMLNAYVSGFGSTRRIVVYDTLLRRGSDDQVRLVVAHELGHAKRNDVLVGTLVGALGVAAAACGAYLLLTAPGLLRRAGADGPGDPRSLALLLFLAAAAGLLGTPANSLVSRRIEARADVHALELTRDPGTFAEMQRQLALANLADLDPHPLVYGVFATHPTAPERIAIARDWARANGLPEPAAAVR